MSSITYDDFSARAVTDENFEKLYLLGEGAHRRVFLVRKRGGHDNGRLYALKEMDKGAIVGNDNRYHQIMMERIVYEAVSGCDFLSSMSYAYHNNYSLNIVMDYASGGDLGFHADRLFLEEEARFYIAELVIALESLHNRGITHGDVKLNNILLDSDGHIALADFDLCRTALSKTLEVRRVGTVTYMAPEIVSRDLSANDVTVDWWAVGVLTYTLLTLRFPFEPTTKSDSYADEYLNCVLTEEPEMMCTFSEEVDSFIRQLLIKDPKSRLGANGIEEVKAHRFFQDIKWSDVLDRKLCPPIKPILDDELDVRNFYQCFTSVDIFESSPARDVPIKHNLFKRFSYVKPLNSLDA